MIDAAHAGAERAIGLLTRVRWLPPMVWARSARGAASLIGPVRFGITRLAHRLISLRSSLMIACQGAARATIEAAGAGVTQVLALLTRLGVLVSISFTGAIGITRDVGRIVVTVSGRALSHLGARTSALRQRKAAAWVCAGIASLAVLVAAMMLLGPRQWPDSLMDRKPAELAVPAPVARTPAPVPVSARQAAPVAVSRPEPARATMQQRPGEARDEILVPVRRPAPAALPSTEAAQNAEASDPAAAIDWLLKGGSSRRHSQSP